MARLAPRQAQAFGMKGRGTGVINVEALDSIDDFLRDINMTTQKLQYGINALAMVLSHAMLGFAQRLSGGPVDTRGQNVAASWRIPVRRITFAYFTGWKVKRLAPGVWMTYNDSREAFFIEFGIHPSGQGVPRPVLKIAYGQTMRWTEHSKIAWRMFDIGFGYMYGARGAARRYEALAKAQAIVSTGRGFAGAA
jgi:hypothetical protein